MQSNNFIFYKKIDSTQNEIWRLIESKTIKNKTLIMADIQTNGKGTHGRIWHTDEEKNIAFSYYIETNCKSENLEGITIEIAQILVKIFKEFYIIHIFRMPLNCNYIFVFNGFYNPIFTFSNCFKTFCEFFYCLMM